MQINITVIFCLALIIVSCNKAKHSPEVSCTEEARAGINIIVKSAATNVLLYDSLVVAIREGAYTETLSATDEVNKVFSGAYERPGVYDLTITHPSYQTGSRSGFVVNRDQCHVIPTQVTMILTHK